jgi:nicotinamide-nucleotide amidase
MTKASIITIGDELLIGQVIDTNSAWIAQQMNKIGITIIRRIAVGDDWDEIWTALDEESTHADIVFITGGLGPTADDITKPLLCKYFDGKMIVNKHALENVTTLFEKVFNRPITERNLKQAEVPDTCEVLVNTRGTAPGMWFEKNGKIFISMPGVPTEMKGLMEDKVIPTLIKKITLPYITHRTLVTFGIGESMLADLLEEFETKLPNQIKLAYLPNFGMVRLRLSVIENNQEEAKELIDRLFSELSIIVKEYLVIMEDAPMEKALATLLIQKNKTVCTAESCTGGYISQILTSIPGSSVYFKGSVIAYSNESKVNLLGVHKETINQNGAVSEAVVKEMVKGAIEKFGTDYAIAVSGIMGPDGGTIEKPVGTVWIAVGNRKKIFTTELKVRFDRQKNIQVTAVNALNTLRIFIQNEL